MKIFPPSSSKNTPAEPAFTVGALASYENDSTLVTCVVLSTDRRKLSVLSEHGKEVSLDGERLHRLPGMMPKEQQSAAQRTQFLQKFHKDSAALAEQVVVKDLWSGTSGEEREYSNRELCELYFGGVSEIQYLAARLALIADKVFFKRKKDLFSPRPPAVVEELERAERVRLEKLHEQELALESLQTALDKPQGPLPAQIASVVRLLEDAASGNEHFDGARQKELRQLLTLCCEKLRVHGQKLELYGDEAHAAFDLLTKAGHFNADTNLALLRHRPRREFDAAVTADARAVRAPGAMADLPEKERTLREDLTRLKCITIDDLSTRDMDDALSLEQTREGWTLGIHISDVAALVADGSPVDAEARKRGTSIYLPEATIDMLPAALSGDTCSLIAGAVRPALSCFFDVLPNLEVTNGRIVPSLIKVEQRMDYERVNDLLEARDPFYEHLYSIAASLEAARLEKGALKVNKREVQVVLGASNEIILVEVDEDSPARSLVSEMMVLANSLLAQFAVSNKIPMIFRTQEPPDESEEKQARAPASGPAADYAVRAGLKRSVASVKPARHSSLALDAYVQSTSPIRRYADLCNQRQILEFMRTGTPYYSAAELEKILDVLEEPLALALTVTKETKRFWIEKYLEKIAERGETIRGTVIRVDLKNPLAELDQVFMPFFVKAPKATLGQELTIKIAAIDPHFDYLRLEAISDSA